MLGIENQNLNNLKDESQKDYYEFKKTKEVLLGSLNDLEDRKKLNKIDEGFIKKSQETYKIFADYLKKSGAKDIDDVNEIYNHFNSSSGDKLIVRRENVERMINLLDNNDIKMHFDPKVVYNENEKYANCALWPYGKNPVTGIANSFLEGKASMGPFVSLIAILPNEKNMEVTEPRERLMNVGTISRESVRILDGTISKSDLQFIILRIPVKFFPQELLNENEKEFKAGQIFRAFIFSDSLKKELKNKDKHLEAV